MTTLGLQVSAFVDAQRLHTERAIDALQLDWLESAVARLRSLVPAPLSRHVPKKLPARFAADQLTRGDRALLPIFKRAALWMENELRGVVRGAARDFSSFWRAWDTRGRGEDALAGYPAAVQVRSLAC